MKTVSVSEMRELDEQTIASGISGDTLMERAGVGAVEHILEYTSKLAPVHLKRFVLLAGKGNNGGDAYVCAKLLYEQTDIEVTVYSVCDMLGLKGDALLNAERVGDNVKVIHKSELKADDFRSGDVIVDGLLGTGISGELKQPYKQWIECVNCSGPPVIALDIPSGLDGTTGKIASVAVMADLTVTIGLPKHGLYLNRGPEYCGVLRVVDIGILPSLIDNIPEDITMPFAEDIRRNIGRVPFLSYKNSRGKLLVAGGCGKYSGAAFLAAKSAMRSGAGYVKMAIPASVGISEIKTPSLVTVCIPDDGGGAFGLESIDSVNFILAESDALVVGPGLGDARGLVPFIENVCKKSLPMVFDADALNIIAEVPEIYIGKDSNILTPHPGEMRRLLEGFDLDGLLASERIEQARGLAEVTDSTIVLKGHRTIICSPDGRLSVNTTGSPVLSVAGTGDCLSGIIGAFVSQGMDAFYAAEAGVFVHGLAGEVTPYGVRGMIPEDLIDFIPEAMRRISPFA